MSTNSLKRLTVKMKRSLSGMTDVWDGYESSEKENESPNHLSRSCASLALPESLRMSPARESPSRRKKLMGSLRSIGSLRSLRSSPLKEKGKRRVGDHIEPEEGPQTPTRPPTQIIRPSLTLNFQQSSPDQPMFDVLRRKISDASSLLVHHSSPMPIPTPAKQEESPFGAPSYLVGGMSETVPTTPGPLQMALERDSYRSPTISDLSPAFARGAHDADPLPTPMPGTNLGFSENDLIGAFEKNQGAASSEHASEPSSYFNISAVESSAQSDTSKVGSIVDHIIYSGGTSHTYPATDVSSVTSTVEEVTNTLHHPRTHRCVCTPVRYNNNHSSNCPIHNGGARRTTALSHNLDNESESAQSETSSINIEHAVYVEYSENMLTEFCAAHDGYFSGSAKAKVGLHMQAHPMPPSNRASFVDPDVHSATSRNTWGTSGSLYDGTGYGGTSSSNSGRPSTSSTAPQTHSKSVGGTIYTADSLVEDSEAMARDHETLNEVIRAYAALEDSGLSESDVEDVIAEVRADVELANEMADHSLGA